MLPQNILAMSYGSKTISRRLAAIEEAASHARNLAPAVAAAVEEDLREAVRQGETLPDLRLLLGLIGRELEGLGLQLAAAHHGHHHAMATESHDRANLRSAAVALRKHLAQVRFVFDRHFGERQGAANFEGRQDVLRIPMHSLERIAFGLLAVFDDPRFGWSSCDHPQRMAWVRAELAELLERYRGAQELCRKSRSRRMLAAEEARRCYQNDGEQVKNACALFAGVLFGAGYDQIARRLRPRRSHQPARRQRRERRAAATSTGSPATIAAAASQGGSFGPGLEPTSGISFRSPRLERRPEPKQRTTLPAAPS